jgi:hypothetical protein
VDTLRVLLAFAGTAEGGTPPALITLGLQDSASELDARILVSLDVYRHIILALRRG